MQVKGLAATLGVALALACGDSTGVTVEDLTGTWVATEIVFTNPANASQSVDLIDQGATFTLTVRSDSTFTTVITEPGEPIETRTGDVSSNGDTLTVAESGQGSPTEFLASRSGDTLTLTTSDEEFDFDGDEAEDPANLRIVLRRQ